jgi:hypothetical protein
LFGTTFELKQGMKHLLAFVGLFYIHAAIAQDSGKVTIGAQKLPFVVLANDVLQNEAPTNQLHLSYIPAGSVTFKVISLDSLKFAERTVFINPDEHIQLEFGIRQKLPYVRLVGHYLDSVSAELLSPIKLEDAQSYTKLLAMSKNNQAFVDQLNEFTSYKGTRGCKNPERLNRNELLEQLEQTLLTRQKTNIIFKRNRRQVHCHIRFKTSFTNHRF